jgi:hypothetical protein
MSWRSESARHSLARRKIKTKGKKKKRRITAEDLRAVENVPLDLLKEDVLDALIRKNWKKWQRDWKKWQRD